MSVLYLLLLIGALVVVHELGHFAAAKLLDIKVTRFSLGFGRPLVRVSGPETEYQIGIIPIGGYTRILGEDETDSVPRRDLARSFHARPLWQRLTVVFAGPAANLMFPIVVYFVFFAGDSRLPAAVIGDVIADSPAERAGMEPGDRILSINGEPVRYWEQVEEIVGEHVGDELRFRIQRGQREREIHLVPVERVQRSRDGRSARGGWIGISKAPFRPYIGVVDSSSPAGREGMRTGDLVISVDGKEVTNWTVLRRMLEGNAGRRTVAYLRGTPVPGIPELKVFRTRVADLAPDTRIDERGRRTIDTGISPAEMFVAHVEPGSPAERTGLRPGDLITTLDDRRIPHWLLLDQALQSDPDREWRIGWRRTGPDGAAIDLEGRLVQEQRAVVDEYGHESRTLSFGARNEVDLGSGEMVAIEGRLGYATSKAIERTGHTIEEMASGFWSILRGETPHESVGGPIMMYRVASVSGAKGWNVFLLMLALISVNLGLINLLPIPPFDGGHVLFLGIEAIRRRPLSERGRERARLAGLAVIAALAVFAVRNDIVRYLQ